MTEAYFLTAEPTEQAAFTKTTYLGQIFTPILDHVIEYAWVELEPAGWVEGARLSIHPVLAGDQIHPVRLTTQTVRADTLAKYPRKKRVFFRLAPWTLIAGIKYAIVLSIDIQWAYVLVNATYDPFPSAYPRGKLIRSYNAGDTWDTTNLGDLYFAEWGDPPLRKTKPELPPNNFAVLDITFFHCLSNTIIYLPSSIPCHLTCYYTDKPPLTHVRTATLRGINIPWSQYFCFVSWQAIEQSEAGDTLYHTFEFPDWLKDQTKWFTFRGNIDAILSPSVGPIFKHTHPGAPTTPIILTPDSAGDLNGLIWQYPDIGEHWDKVDDIIPDDDATYVYRDYIINGASDSYNLQNLPASVKKVTNVTVRVRYRRVAQNPAGGYPTTISYGLRIAGQNFTTSHNTSSETYIETSRDYAVNPATGEDWTLDDINTLQVYIWMRLINRALWEGGLIRARTTQLYVEVTYCS